LLIKQTTFNKIDLENHYIDPLKTLGVDPKDIISFTLDYNEQDKCPVSLIKHCLKSLLRALEGLGVTTLCVADSAYFKTLTKQRKSEPHYGDVLACQIKGYEHMRIILSINYKSLFYKPALQNKLDMSLSTLAQHILGKHVSIGANIIHYEYYPDDILEIQAALQDLLQYDVLTCDIETFSLQFNKAGISSISFAWTQHEGIAFTVDFRRNPMEAVEIKCMLLEFFEQYTGKLIYHGSTFDVKILIYELFMKDELDYKGLLYGLEVMFRDIDDTRIITYLAVNSTTRNELSLKANAFEFAGNYAIDIADINQFSKQEVLRYNLIDSLCTWYVHNKNYPIMVQDKQLDIYQNIKLPSLKVITQMELVGMPLNISQVEIAKEKLQSLLDKQTYFLQHNPIIINYEDQIREETRTAHNAKLKKKVKPLSDFIDLSFNPNSTKQIADLLFNRLGFDVVDTTDTGLPATGAKTLKKLLNQIKRDYTITDENLNGK